MILLDEQKKIIFSIVTIMFICFLNINTSESDIDKEEITIRIPLETVNLDTRPKPRKIKTIIKKSRIKEVKEVKEELVYYSEFTYSKNLNDNDKYLLAKIAMSESEGESTQGKTLVILSVLNRVNDESFPNTVSDVINQKVGDVYQFSSVKDGRFERLEPSEDCWEAVKVVMESKYDYSGGSLYFESCNNKDSWHQRNLEFLYQEGNHRFYK